MLLPSSKNFINQMSKRCCNIETKKLLLSTNPAYVISGHIAMCSISTQFWYYLLHWTGTFFYRTKAGAPTSRRTSSRRHMRQTQLQYFQLIQTFKLTDLYPSTRRTPCGFHSETRSFTAIILVLFDKSFEGFCAKYACTSPLAILNNVVWICVAINFG